MKIDDILDWCTLKPINKAIEGCEIQCPDCQSWSSHLDYTESEVSCDGCGSHSAIQCPECYHNFDFVYNPVFECRINLP